MASADNAYFVQKSADRFGNPPLPQSQIIDSPVEEQLYGLPPASSPDPFEYPAAFSPPVLPTSMSETPGTRSRPLLRNRSISSPLLRHQHVQASSKRVASGVNDMHISRPRREHQWSVFGQLMENEGQMPTPGFSRSERRLSSQSRNDRQSSPLSSSPSAFIQSPLLEENLQQFPFAAPTAHPDGYDSDSSDTSTTSELHPLDLSKSRSWFFPRSLPSISISYRNMLKCAIAYFIASLFTFSPYLSHLIGSMTSYGPGPHEPSPSGHMVATMWVSIFNMKISPS